MRAEDGTPSSLRSGLQGGGAGTANSNDAAPMAPPGALLEDSATAEPAAAVGEHGKPAPPSSTFPPSATNKDNSPDPLDPAAMEPRHADSTKAHNDHSCESERGGKSGAPVVADPTVPETLLDSDTETYESNGPPSFPAFPSVRHPPGSPPGNRGRSSVPAPSQHLFVAPSIL